MPENSAIPNEIPVACSLSTEEKEERGPQLSALFTSAEETRELTRGYALRYPPETDITIKLVDAIVKERECCPFFEFKLEFLPGNGPLWFYIEGPEGTKELIGPVASRSTE